MNSEEYLSFMVSYFKKNRAIAKDIVEKYINSESMSVNLDAFISMLPEILYSLYNFISTSDYVSKIIKDDCETLENDYLKLTEKLIYIWTHASIPLTISWERNSNEFYRRILIPLRFNLSDIMYGALSTMRSQMSELVYLEVGEYAFVSNKEYSDQDDYTYLASDYASYAIYSLNDAKMCYGYMDPWIFNIKANHIRILDDSKALEPMLLIDAKGFGIFEGNQENVLFSIGDPMYQTKDNVKAKEMLGVDFSDTKIEDIKANLRESFYLTQYRYEAKEE